ncbi:hypothetical protein ACFVXW_10345 [Streptomyces sp. NPDC058251]|uniref:hypothetical protein n=1 Tax=Streptomyces sp. NPDC058251 TaxID=3346404 RepID=UPI0036EF7B1C
MTAMRIGVRRLIKLGGGGLAAPDRALLGAELAQVGFGEFEDLVSSAGEDGPGGEQGEALDLLEGDLRGQRQLVSFDANLDQRRSVVSSPPTAAVAVRAVESAIG